MFRSSRNSGKFDVLSRLAAFILTAALMICTLPPASQAAPVSTPLTISFYTLHCIEDTDEANPDKPYVVFFVANLKSGVLAPTVAKRSTLFWRCGCG
jgi:hypothetical protein